MKTLCLILLTVLRLDPVFAASQTQPSRRIDLSDNNRLERLYLQHAAPNTGIYSGQNLTILMLFSRHAQQQTESRINAYLARDLVPIFESNPAAFVARLAQIPSLTQAVCNRLNAYFETMPNPHEDRKMFLNKYSNTLASGLEPSDFALCLNQFADDSSAQSRH